MSGISDIEQVSVVLKSGSIGHGADRKAGWNRS
jgi:hypothetical protein